MKLTPKDYQGMADKAAPVSYTHLDVYKRQVKTLPKNVLVEVEVIAVI